MLGKLTAKRETVKALLFIDTTLLLVCVQRFALLPLLLLWFDDLLDSILWFGDLLEVVAGVWGNLELLIDRGCIDLRDHFAFDTPHIDVHYMVVTWEVYGDETLRPHFRVDVSLESDSTEANSMFFEADIHIRTLDNFITEAMQCSILTHRRASSSEPGLLGLRSHRCERQGLGFHRCQGSRGTYFESRPQTDSNKCIHNSTFLKYPSIFLHADYCGIPFYIFHL